MKTSDRKPLGENTEEHHGNNSDTPYANPRNHFSRKRTLNRLMPFLMLFVFATLILKDQVPAVGDKIDAFFNPEGSAAVRVCRKAALSQSATPDFARLIKPGKANATNKGFFVDQLVIGEMDEQGGERRVDIACHIDQNGELVKLNRTAHKKESIATENKDNYHEQLTSDTY